MPKALYGGSLSTDLITFVMELNRMTVIYYWFILNKDCFIGFCFSSQIAKRL
jgi:hypothetical protein